MKTSLMLAAIFFSFISCQDEKNSNSKKEDVLAISEQLKTGKLQKQEFFLINDTIIIGEKGTRIWIHKDVFQNYTNGKIQLELKEFYSKEDMILNKLATITNKGELLESSGMFYVNFTENGKQLELKKGKNIVFEIKKEPLQNSNIYYNPTDSVFKWELTENKLNLLMIDRVQNAGYGISVKEDGIGGFFKSVPLDSVAIVQKRDSIILADTNFQLDIENNIFNFTSDKLGWLNIDSILNYEVLKEITLKNNNQDLKYFSCSLIYQNYQTFYSFDLSEFSKHTEHYKIKGPIKMVIYSFLGKDIYFDSFIIDKNSKKEHVLNFKKTSLADLKKELISR